MKNDNSTNNFQDSINGILSSNKFKYFILFSLAYLISLTLTAQEIVSNQLVATTAGYAEVKTATDTDRPQLQYLSLKIQINPPYSQTISDYIGLPIDLLSADNEPIMTGVLDQKGQVRFDVLTPLSLEHVSIYSAATEDKITVKNPNGAVIGFLISTLYTSQDI